MQKAAAKSMLFHPLVLKCQDLLDLFNLSYLNVSWEHLPFVVLSAGNEEGAWMIGMFPTAC